MEQSSFFVSGRAAVERRGVHLDLKGLPPTPGRLVDLLGVFAAMRYNVVLVEWEDSFPWTVDERFRSPTAYSPDEVTRFVEAADERGIELIPLVQCLGHMETVLDTPGYEHLREVPGNSTCLNPLAPGASELIQGMVDDVLALMPGVEHVHLGGDEAWLFGTHPETKAYIEEQGRGALYLQHVGPILANLNARGVRPMLWHDMMLEWDGEALRAFAAESDLVVWGYRGSPETTEGHFKTEYIERFAAHGIAIWGATAYKGCGDRPERHVADRPVATNRVENAAGWADVAGRFGLEGVIATAWSRFSVDTMQCEPIDAALDALLDVGVVLHEGGAPAGGPDARIEALGAIGERERFTACSGAMDRLTAVRRDGWNKIRDVRQQLTLARRDRRRRSARNRAQGMKVLGHLASIVRRAEKVEEETRAAFDGLIDPTWIDEYLSTRIDPLREELAELDRIYRSIEA